VKIHKGFCLDLKTNRQTKNYKRKRRYFSAESLALQGVVVVPCGTFSERETDMKRENRAICSPSLGNFGRLLWSGINFRVRTVTCAGDTY